MKMHSIVKTVSPEAAFYLGMVMAAFNNRAFCRANCTGAAENLKVAKQELEASDYFGKWGNEQAYNFAHGQAEDAIKAKIASEKFYKKTKADFLAAFPQYTDVLETMMPGSTKDRQL